MLKKSGAVLLAMLYVVTVLGFVLNLRYGDKQASFVKTADCGQNKSAEKMQCCLKTKMENARQADEPSLLSRFFWLRVATFTIWQPILHAATIVSRKVFL